MKFEKLLLPVATIVLMLAASLLRFKTVLSGDSLFLENLSTDLFHYGGHWADWKFTAAPGFVPDMLLYFIAYPLFASPFDRIFAVSFAQALLLAAVCVWFARRIHPQLSRRAGAAIVLGVALVTLAAARSGMWLYYHSTNNHLAALLFGLAALVAALRYAEQPSWLRALWLPLAIGVATVSTNLFTLNFTVPALLVLGIAWLRADRDAVGAHRRTLASLAGQVAAGAVLAALLEKLLIHHAAIEGKVHTTPDTAGRALTLFMRVTGDSFDRGNPWTFSVALLLLAALLFTAWRLVRAASITPAGVRLAFDANPRIAATGAFLAVAAPLNLVGVLVSGHFADEFAYRYLAFPLALAALLAIVLLDRHRTRWPWHALLAIGVACIVKGSVTMLHHTQPLSRRHAIADCLLDLAHDGVPVQAGISEFWMGPLVSAYSGIPITTTLNDLTPFHWVNTLGPLLRPQAYPAYRYHFALLRAPRDAWGFNYTHDTIGKLLPKPDHVYLCPNDTEVWVYQGMELDTAVRAAAARYFQAKGIRP